MSIANKNKNFKTIILNNKVLKPTGASEILINSSINILNNLKNKKILDLGCGSGVVNISASKRIPKKFIHENLSQL